MARATRCARRLQLAAALAVAILATGPSAAAAQAPALFLDPPLPAAAPPAGAGAAAAAAAAAAVAASAAALVANAEGLLQGAPVKLTAINAAAMDALPSRFSLALPGLRTPLIVESTAAAAASSPSDGAAGAANGCADAALLAGVCVWTGRARGARPGESMVLLHTSPGGGVYGHVSYLDRATKAVRTFKIAPAKGALPEAAAAAAAAPPAVGAAAARASPPAAAAGLLHTVSEHEPPKHGAAKRPPPALEALAAAAAAEAARTVDTTPPGGAPAAAPANGAASVPAAAAPAAVAPAAAAPAAAAPAAAAPAAAAPAAAAPAAAAPAAAAPAAAAPAAAAPAAAAPAAAAPAAAAPAVAAAPANATAAPANATAAPANETAPAPAANATAAVANTTANATAAANTTAGAPAAPASAGAGTVVAGGPPPGFLAPAGRRLRQAPPPAPKVTVDLLAVYTSNAKAAVGVDSLSASIRTAVAFANQVYRDSGINSELRLVGIREAVGYDATTKRSADILDDAASGIIPNVLSWRAELGADLVTVWAPNTDVGGMAYVIGADGPREWGFSLVARSGWDTYVLAHEVGHNHGCNHDVERDLGRGEYAPYSFGYKRCDLGDGNFHTILSYGICIGSRPPRLNLISSPAVLYRGAKAGDELSGDCARTHRETAPRVASFYPTKVAMPGDEGSVVGNRAALDLCWEAGPGAAAVAAAPCAAGGAAQRFSVRPDGTIRAVGADRCIELVASSLKVQLAACNSTATSQDWFVDAAGRVHPYAFPDKCLTLPPIRPGVLTLVVTPCSAAPTQAWMPAPAWPAAFRPANQAVRSALTGFCLDVQQPNATAPPANGAAGLLVNGTAGAAGNVSYAVVRKCGAAPTLTLTQQWALDGNNYLRPRASARKCLEALNTTLGAPVALTDCPPNRSGQRWFQDSSGRLRPFNAPARCLDILGGSTSDGARLQLWDCLDSVAQQRWNVDATSATKRVG